MRRKRAGSAPMALGPAALRERPADDPAQPYAVRISVFEEWLEERDQWVARREAYEEAYGWPGGPVARGDEESEAHPVGDAPFDPDWEIEHGRL